MELMEVKCAAGEIVSAKSTATPLTRNQKILIITAAVGVTAVGLMARYFRRPTRPTRGRGGSNPLSKATLHLKGNDHVDSTQRSIRDGSTDTTTIGTLSANISPRPPGQGHGLHERGRCSVTSSILTQSTLISNSVIDPTASLTCTQLGVLGLETLEKSVTFWEESLNLVREEKTSADLTEEEEAQCDRTIKQLERILQAAYNLQRLSEELYLDEGSVLYEESERASYGQNRLRSVSSVESFMSAEDFLSDDEDIRQSLESAGIYVHPGEAGGGDGEGIFPLYEAALRLVEGGAVPYRSLKTEMVGCQQGDQEYLAKLHCLRGAFSKIISDVEKRSWISKRGKEVFSQILLKADKDPADFETSYNAIISWSGESCNWGLLESELKDRGLRALTFYDIVLDYIFLDAFEDLDAPPASVLAVTQNRWLSNSFKETALSTAVWSVLKTKRKWLRYSDGFMAHFYTLSEHIMPTLAWGFLGPPNTIQDLCFFFKDKFLEFLNSLFSFEDVRYSSLDDLSEDVMKRLELMHALIIKRISEIPSPY